MNATFTANNNFTDSKLFAIDYNHLLLLGIDNTWEHFDVCLLRLDFTNKECNLIASERVRGTDPEVIFDYTNRQLFVLRFYDNYQDSLRLGRIEKGKVLGFQYFNNFQ
jgi:hypothetical protein